MSDKILDFTLNFINEKHLKSTNTQMRRFAYTRVFFASISFFQHLSLRFIDEKEHLKARNYLKNIGNIFD